MTTDEDSGVYHRRRELWEQGIGSYLCAAEEPMVAIGEDIDAITAADDDDDNNTGTAAIAPSNIRERQQYAVVLDSWSTPKPPPGRSALLRRLRYPFPASTRKYRTHAARGNKEAAAVQLSRQLSLARAWVQWTRFVEMCKDAGVLFERAVKHFRHGLAARAFYTWLGCFDFAQRNHRQLLQAVAIGNLSRLSRAWRSWRSKTADVVKARNHLLARSREREITHEHHMHAINAQRMAILKSAGRAHSSGAPDGDGGEGRLTVSALGDSFTDRETALLSHQIAAVAHIDPEGTSQSASSSAVHGIEEVEAVVAYCRACVTCHECHAMMRSGELFVCLRRGMPSHLHCFQDVMRTSVLYLEFPMPLADVHAVSTVFEFVRFVHQHHRIHALTRFQRYIRIVHAPLAELQRMNEEEEAAAAARTRVVPVPASLPPALPDIGTPLFS